MGFIFFTHVLTCSVKTELIRRNNYANKQFQLLPEWQQSESTVFHVLCFCNGVVARKIEHPLSANSNNIFSAILSQIPCGLSSLMEYHFFSEPGPINDYCPIPNFFAYLETTLAFATHSFSLSFVPQEMSLNIDINRFLPVKFFCLLRT